MTESGNFVSGPDGAPAGGTGPHEALVRELSALPTTEQTHVLLGLVREHTLEVLRATRPGTTAVETGRPFRELGLDSVALVELHTRLSAATGLSLPPTVAFDHPSPAELAAHLRTEALELPERDGPAPRPGRHSDDPIAVVGIGCRYPGGVASPEDLWRLVDDGTHIRDTFPDDRGWDLDRLFDEDPATPGTTYARHGGFLPDAADFDADFFGISPARPWRWTRSSGWSWRPCGRRWSGRASTRPPCAAAVRACSSPPSRRSTRCGCTRRPTASTATSSAATRPASSPAASPTPSARRPRADRGHRLLRLPGRAAPGRTVPAQR
ncbi:hypothetical protein HFP43_19695 [Streptomyces sp. SJ1-7]|nr:hypothetical protein [Streptomyces sp. SJ1-7]